MAAIKIDTGLYELRGRLMLERDGDHGDVYPLTDCCRAAVRADRDGAALCGVCAGDTGAGTWTVSSGAADRQQALAAALLERGIGSAEAWALAAAVWADVDALDGVLAEDAIDQWFGAGGGVF